jgi:hypothetical protein
MKNRTENTGDYKYSNYYCNIFDMDQKNYIYSSIVNPIWDLKRIYLIHLISNK